MIDKKKLVKITESAIDELITTFKRNPYFFYTENDLHCYLYNEIFNKLPIKEWQCQTGDGKTSILLHKEYPTKARYVAKNLKKVTSRGARGHFDLSIWNPEETENRLFRVANSTDFENEQHTFIALEFDLVEGNKSFEAAMHHFKWDLLKLTSEENQVEYGYSLVFVRDWANKDDFITKARSEAAKAKNTIVLYIEKDKTGKLGFESLPQRHLSETQKNKLSCCGKGSEPKWVQGRVAPNEAYLANLRTLSIPLLYFVNPSFVFRH